MTDYAVTYRSIRAQSEALCRPLEIEDYGLQGMADASPPKWHLAHTSWFFETFLLAPFLPGYRPSDPRYAYLFNSYYEAAGPRHPRPQRGMLSRPTVSETYAYRAYVDQHLQSLLEAHPDEAWSRIEPLVQLGLNHEQQHQELILTDLLYSLSLNPLRPAYHNPAVASAPAPPPHSWHPFDGGVVQVGHDGEGFGFDNEGPRHSTYLQPFRLGTRLVTNAEYREFIEAGGYHQPQHWLSEGWRTVQEQGWSAPLYWEREEGGEWSTFSLRGMHPLEPHAPVCHVSYFEADAYVRWAGARLPTEFEWEHAAASAPVRGNLLESGLLEPAACADSSGLAQLFGDVWEWTASPYVGYPGYRPAAGAVGEYNGKFMCNQLVLRGGSCATPTSHIRATYRNFFPPQARWQFSGIRLAQDGS